MEKQILNYQTSLTPHLLKEVQAYTKRENVELLGGQGGLALYFLSQWVKTGQSRSLLQAQLSLKKALLGINKLYEEGNHITYWTARGSTSKNDYYKLTKKQLVDWGCKYHELRTGEKPYYDLLICDKTKGIEEI